jgi:hypothetical protein
MADKKEPEKLKYDSNPFTISFRGFGMLAQFAKGVVITTVVFSILGLAFNTIGQIVSIVDDNNSSSNSSFETNFSRDDTQENVFDLDVNDDQSITINTNGESQTLTSSEIGAIVGLIIGVLLIITIVLLPLGVAINSAIKGFVAAGMVASIKNKNISFGETFSAMSDRYGVLFVSELIATLKIIGGYILFIVPGVRAQLRYEALPYVIMSDEDVKAKEALTRTKHLYEKHLMEVLGIKFVGSIIPFIGMAITAGGIGLSQHQLAHYKDNDIETPKTHWLNYLPFLLVALLLFVIGTFAAILVAALR